MSIVNRKEFADILGKDPKTVGKMIEEGMPVMGGGGRGKSITIDTSQAIRWLVEHEIIKQLGGDSADGPQPGTRDAEELLLTIAKRRKADVEADKAEDSVIDLGVVEQFFYEVATLFGHELTGLGARLCTDVSITNEPAKCKKLIDDEGHRIRVTTADRILGYVADYRTQRSRDSEATADEECGGVGERQSHNAAGQSGSGVL